MLLVLALWVVLSLVVGIWARNRGRSKVTWLLIALLVSPLIAAVLLVYARDLSAEDVRPSGPSRTKRFFRVVLNILMALVVIAILISILNRGGIKPIHIAQTHRTTWGAISFTREISASTIRSAPLPSPGRILAHPLQNAGTFVRYRTAL